MQMAVSMEPGASRQVLEMEGGIMMVVLATVGVATMAAELEALVVALVTVALAAVTVGKVVMAAA